MKKWFHVFIMSLIGFWSVNSFATDAAANDKNDFPPDVSCVGQTPAGDVMKVTLNLTARDIMFQNKHWPISVMKYSVKGVLSAASTGVVGQPDTYFVLVIKETQGDLLLYDKGTLSGTTQLICQDVTPAPSKP